MEFYFQVAVEGIEETLALCSLYSPINELHREHSNSTLNVCSYKRGKYLVVIEVKSILSVIAMVPFEQGETGNFFLVEHFALGVIDTAIID